MASEYATAAHGQIEPDLIRRSSAPYYYSLLQTLREFAGSGAVIDYGAGWGGLVEILINSGFQCQGLELSSAMVAECQARGLPVEQKSLREIDQRQSVAAIAMCGVFEHLLDPRTFLKDAYAVLTPDGVIVSLQPTSNFALIVANVLRLGRRSSELPSAFWVFDPPWHVALYSVKGMRAIAEEAGFELVSTRFAPQGRMKGLYGIVQVVVGGLNRIGWALLRERWPLMVSHIYVLKKRARS